MKIIGCTYTQKEIILCLVWWKKMGKKLIDKQWRHQSIVILNKSFKENNLPERMKKAFKRLVELYGGQIKKKFFKL